LTDGAHAVAIRASDQAGNIDSSPASRSFTVDTTIPQVTLSTENCVNGGTTLFNEPVFNFKATQVGGSELVPGYQVQLAKWDASSGDWGAAQAVSNATSDDPWPAPLENAKYKLTVSAQTTAGVTGAADYVFTVNTPDIVVSSSGAWEGDMVGVYADPKWIPSNENARPSSFSWKVTKPGDPAAITSDSPFGFVALDTKAAYQVQLKVTDDVATDADGKPTGATGAASVRDTTVSTTPVKARVHALNVTVLDGQSADLVGRFLDPGWSQAHTATWSFDKAIGDVPASLDEDNFACMDTGYVYGTTRVLHTSDNPIAGTLTVSDDTGEISDTRFTITVRANEASADEANNREGSTSPALDSSAPDIVSDGEILQSYVGSANDVDVFEVTQPNGDPLECGTEVLVTLGNLPVDCDLAVIEDASQQTETVIPKVGLEGTSFPNGDAWADAGGIWGRGGGIWGRGGGIWGRGGGIWGRGGGIWGRGGGIWGRGPVQEDLGAVAPLTGWQGSPVVTDAYEDWMDAGGIWGRGGGIWGRGGGIWGRGGGIWGRGGGVWGRGGGVWGRGGGVWGRGDEEAYLYRSPDVSMLYSHLAPRDYGNQLDGYSFYDMGFTGMDATRTAGGDVTFEELGFNNQEAAGKSISGMSAHSGTETEVVLAKVDLVEGHTYIAVKGANGAYSTEHPYTLQVETSSPLNLSKLLNTTDESVKVTGDDATDSTQTLAEPQDASPATLFVTQAQRMSKIYGAARWTTLKDALAADCTDPLIDGAVISVPSKIYDEWDKQPWNTQRANDATDGVREAIHDYIYGHGEEGQDNYVAPHTSIKYVVLVGSDEAIPQRRVPDQTVIGNELSYAWDAGLNIDSAILGSMYDSMILTDDFYVDADPIPYNGRSLYVPDLAVSRLVETPEEIAGSVQHFRDSNGVLADGTSVMSSVVTGQDWMKDGAERVKSILANADLTPSDAVPFDSWTVQNAEDALSPASAKIGNLNAHFTHYGGISADGCTKYADGDESWTSEFLTSSDIAGSPSFEGKLVFTLGCHAGLNVPDDQTMGEESGMSPKLDVAQAMAQQQGVLVASTGFGLGNLDGIGGTEELVGTFADQLTTSQAGLATGQPIGLALAMAKHKYFTSKSSVTPYDEKSSIQFTLYGMPQYRVKCRTHQAATGLRGTGATTPASATFEGHFEPTTLSLNLTDEDETLPPITTQLVEPNSSTTTARYITSNGDAQATAGRPVEYRLVYDLGAAGEHPVTAAIVTGGKYVDIPDFDPAIGHAANEWEANPAEPQICADGWWPSSPVMVSSLDTPDGLEQQLIVTGQFMRTSDDGDPIIGVERVWTGLNVKLVRRGVRETEAAPVAMGLPRSLSALIEQAVTEAAGDDYIAPTVTSVTLSNVGHQWTATVDASDASGISRIDVTQIGDERAQHFTASFTPDPSRTAAYITPFSLPDVARDDVSVMVEVYDGVNNVTTATAKGYLVTGPPTGSMVLNHGAAASYSRLVTLDSANVDNARDMRVSFDSGTTWSDWRPYLRDSLITLPGLPGDVHVTVEYRNADPGTLELSADVTLEATPVAGGMYHTVAVKSGGGLWAWGSNSQGELGDSALGFGPFNTPRSIGAESWTAVAAGYEFTVGLKADGTLWSWGSNGAPTTNGVLGRPGGSSPAQISGGGTWKAVTAGWQHSLAVKTDGTLWAWGRNDQGQVGNGSTVNQGIPFEVSSDTHWVAVAAGFGHSLALKDDGTLWAWGDNQSGQLGNGAGPDQHQPVQLGGDNDWAVVAAGSDHSIAIKADGSLWTWGSNASGQLGDGTTADRDTPVQVGRDGTWTAVAGGSLFTLAVKSDRTLWAWGHNVYGELGAGSPPARETSPIQVGSAADWVGIAAGDFHGLGIRSDGELWDWGWETNCGVLGDGQTYGQVDSPASISLELTDVIPPASQVEAPGFDDDWHNTDFSVHLTATDASGVRYIEYRINDAAWQKHNGAAATVTVHAVEDHSNDGANRVSYYAVDDAGNLEASKSGVVKIDTTPPETTDDAPTDVASGPVTVTLTPADEASGMSGGLAETDWSLDSGESGTGTTVGITGEGAHVLTYHSVDAVGNAEVDRSVTVTISTSAAVTSPSAGDTWVIGSTQTIAWNPSGGGGISGAWLSRDGGTLWEPIPGASSWEDDGDGDWTVTGSATTTARIKVENALGTATSGLFTIAEPAPLTITSPNGGDGWLVGSTQSITWTNGGAGNVDIDLSRDNGATWESLFTSIPNTHSATWPVSGPDARRALIRVSDGSDSDSSDAVFTIETSLFAPPLSYTLGWPANAIASGDFNNDGKVDLATASSYDSTVDVLLGNGDGTLQAAHDYTFGLSTPIAMAAADFNADGRDDLVTANQYDGTVSVMLAQPDGTFTAVSTYDTGIQLPSSLAVADLDSNGRYDVVTSGQASGSSTGAVSILRQNLDGTFGPATTYPIATGLDGVALGDLNGDYAPDVVATNEDANTISVLLNDGSGGFTAGPDEATGYHPRFVAIADFNGDLQQDVVTSGSSGASVLLGNGDGTLAHHVDLTGGCLGVGDVNGDGNPDILTGNGVRLGKGDGTFWPRVDYPVLGTSGVVSADFNGDQRTDLATVGGNVNVLVNSSVAPDLLTPGATQNETWLIGKSLDITWTPGTGGLVDIEISRDGWNTWEPLFMNTPNDGFETWTVTGPAASWVDIRVSNDHGADWTHYSEDIEAPVLPTVTSPTGESNWIEGSDQVIRWTPGNGGNVDVSVSHDGGAHWDPIATNLGYIHGHGYLHTWTVTGPATSQALIRVSNAAGDGYSSDFTIVGAVPPELTGPVGGEVLVTNTTHTITWDPGNGGYVTFQVSHDNGENWEPVYGLNGANDGSEPWTVTGPATNQALFRITTSSGSDTSGPFTIDSLLAAPADYGVGSSPGGVTLADLNGDNARDIVVANHDDATISVLLNDGSGAYPTMQTYPTAAGPVDVAAGDFSGDGKIDLAVAADGGMLSELPGDGSGTFPNDYDLSVGSSSDFLRAVEATDINGDGMLDLAVANWTANRITAIITFGGTFQRSVTAPEDIAAGDFNNDGNNDLAVLTDSGTVLERGYGDGSFAPFGALPHYSAPIAVAAGDFNQDDRDDLVGAEAGAPNLTIGTSDGSFAFSDIQNCYYFGSNAGAKAPDRVAAADMNGDGYPDIIVASAAGDLVTVLANNGAGRFMPSESDYSVPGGPQRISVADLNGDGRPDIVTSNGGNGTVSVLLNTCPSRPVVTSPNGGQNWPVGETRDITWSGDTGPVTVKLSRDGGTTWETLSGSATGTSYSWTVAGPNTSQALIKVCGRAGEDVSDTPFTIAAPAAPVLGSPNGGESWIQGESRAITWSPGNGGPVTIELWRNGGPWETLFTGVGNDGSKAWTVAGSPAIDAVIRISNDCGVSTSAALFTIVAAIPPSVTSPNGGEIWTFGQDRDITWTQGNGGDVAIELSRDNGANWETIAASTPNDGTFTWSPTDPGTGDTLIRVSSSSGSDASDARFQLGSFSARADYAAGSWPWAVTTGDFNGDGKQDMVTANEGNNTVSVFMGDGVGGFGAEARYATGGGPRRVAVGDFNRDGRLDLATANWGSGNVSILLGSGTGTFPSHVEYSTGGGCEGLAVGDFNSDGVPDVAAANNNGNSVSVLLGTGTGALGAATTYSGYSNPVSVAVGDFNADGVQDLAVANYGTSGGAAYKVSVLLGNGSGGFPSSNNYAASSDYSRLRSINVGDLNKDGLQDLVVQADSAVSVLWGSGSGTFPTYYKFNQSVVMSVSLADVNGDGNQDVITTGRDAAGAGYSVGIRFGTGSLGTGSLGAPVYYMSGGSGTGNDPRGIAACDFDRDGRMDLAIANTPTDSASVLIQRPGTTPGALQFAAKVDHTTGSIPKSVAVGDFNGDGRQDLAAANDGGDTVSVLLGGGGTFATKVDYATGSTPQSVAVGDFNGDGRQDLAATNANGDTVSVLLGSGGGTFATKVDYATGDTPESVAVGDFNGDGRQDLAAANDGGDTVSVLLGGGGGTFATKVDYATGAGSHSVAVGDFNRDGKVDLAVANLLGNTVSVLLGSGGGAFAARVNYPTGATPESVAVGDFDRDGKLDLATANYLDNSVSILLGSGTGTFAAKTDYATGATPQSVAVGDFNGDGRQDLATANGGGDSVSVLLGSGSGAFAAKVDNATGATPESVAVGDFNRDGRQDLATANFDANSVSVLLNTTSR
jgi:hypothetical protein